MSDKSIDILKQLKALAISVENKRTAGELFADDMEDLLGTLTGLDVDRLVLEAKLAGKAPEGEAYLLCEEQEDSGGIRMFSVLEASTDKDALNQLVEAKAKKDETGLLGLNGVEEWDTGSVSSNYVDEQGFVTYYVQRINVLTREQAMAKLNSEEYRDDFQVSPSFRDIMIEAIKYTLEDKGFILEDPEKAADALQNDSAFRGMVKTAWWHSSSTAIKVEDRLYPSVKNYIIDFLDDALSENPDWFVDIGAATRFEYPKGMDQIMLDAIYDVSKAHALPLTDPQRQASEFLKHNEFYNLFQSLDIQDDLKLADTRQEIYDLSYQYIEKELAPREKEAESDLSDRVADANYRVAIATTLTKQADRGPTR